MTPREKIKTLRRLQQEATPGPWMFLGTPRGYRMLAPAQTQAEEELKHEPNLRLMEATLNALPALLDLAEAAAEVRRLAGEYDPDDPHIPTLHALEEGERALDTALARLGEGE